jgi:hypothetical protein
VLFEAGMNDWRARKLAGDLLERRVKLELQARGWTVDSCGQGTFSPEIQEALSRGRSALRNFPDMIAARGMELVAIDAKGRMPTTTTGRYSVSCRCVTAGLQFIGSHAPVPLYYVFADLRVLTPAEISSYQTIGKMHSSGEYYLIEARHARPFDHVFGARTPSESAEAIGRHAI